MKNQVCKSHRSMKHNTKLFELKQLDLAVRGVLSNFMSILVVESKPSLKNQGSPTKCRWTYADENSIRHQIRLSMMKDKLVCSVQHK